MSDIPKMLRAEALIADEDWTGISGISPDLAFAAASRIEKLEAALREITESARLVGDYYHVKIARKALEGKDER